MQYLLHHQIDKAKWDNCIENSQNGIIYGYSWWLDIVSPGWEALVESDYQYIMPLTCRKKFFIEYLFQPLATQQLGIFSTDLINENLVVSFLKNIPSRFKLIDIQLNTSIKFIPEDFKAIPRKTHELNLGRSYKSILAGFSDNCKRNINKSKRNDLLIARNVSIDEIISLFKHNRGIEANLSEDKYALFKKLADACVQKIRTEILAVKNKIGKVIAAAIFVKSHKKVIFLFSGRDEEAKEKGAMFYLIDSFIQEKAGQKITLDFEGSDDPDLARFYKGFGSKECIYQQIKKNRLPFFIKK